MEKIYSLSGKIHFSKELKHEKKPTVDGLVWVRGKIGMKALRKQQVWHVWGTGKMLLCLKHGGKREMVPRCGWGSGQKPYYAPRPSPMLQIIMR